MPSVSQLVPLSDASICPIRVWIFSRARPRVPSFYALEAVRAAEGRLPNFAELDRRAEAESSARIGWPAPDDPAEAIDHAEYDLAVLARFLNSDPGQSQGTARYLLTTNSYLGRALRTRWQKWSPQWTPADGLIKPSAASRSCNCETRTRYAQLLADRAPKLCCLSVQVFPSGHSQACTTGGS